MKKRKVCGGGLNLLRPPVGIILTSVLIIVVDKNMITMIIMITMIPTILMNDTDDR